MRRSTKEELRAMNTEEHYSLRWNNHQNHILRAFDTLLQTKTLVDVTLVCAETSIRAHKMVLSACSPFFQRVFSETPCKHPVIVLKDFRGWVMQAIIDFMYRGEISVPQERLQTLIQAGESLQVRGLVENTMTGNTPTPAASPDEFGIIENSRLPSEMSRCSNYDEESSDMLTGNSKLLSQTFGETGHSANIGNREFCTSPQPRRKQARPRRRSGECGPHDLSKIITPSSGCIDSINAHRKKPEDNFKTDDAGRSSQNSNENSNSQICNTNKEEEDDCEGPENLCTKKERDEIINEENCNNNMNNNNNNNNRIVLSLKDIRHLNKPPTIVRSSTPFHHSHLIPRGTDNQSMKSESIEGQLDGESPFPMEQMDLTIAAAAAAAAQQQHQQQMVANNLLGIPNSHQHGLGHERIEDMAHRLGKDFTSSSPMSLSSHFNPPDGLPHPPSPLPFHGMSSALGLTPPHMFGLDSSLGLFPPGMDTVKLYNPLMDMSDPRGLSNDHPPFLKKKMSRPKGQHSAPRGGPPRSWTNAELTEALQHVWNKKMTTSQASRIFGIPYNSLLMYVRGKYGKSLKLEQLRKDCISGPPIELLTMGISGNNNNPKTNNENRTKDIKDLEGSVQRSSSSEPDLLSSPNPLFNPFPPGFYPDFSGAFPGLPLSMLNLLPPERHQASAVNMNINMDEDCKSDRSKHSLEEDFSQPLALNRNERREILHQNMQD